MKKHQLLLNLLFSTTVIFVFSCNRSQQKNETTDNIDTAEARSIAKEAYIYGFPIVDNSRIQYAYFVNKQDPDYKAA